MRLTLACLVDAGTVSGDGKINLLGVFNTLYAGKFPTTHPHMAYVARLEFEAGDSRQHSIQVRIVDDDGQLVNATPEGTVQLQENPPGEVVVAPLVMGINNARFTHPGTYTFELLVDGQRVMETYLYVRARPPAP